MFLKATKLSKKQVKLGKEKEKKERSYRILLLLGSKAIKMILMKILTTFIILTIVVHGLAQDTTSNNVEPGTQASKDTIIQHSDQVELFSALDSLNYYFGITLGYSIKGASFKSDPALVAVGLYQAMMGNAPIGMETAQEMVQEINQRLIDEKLASAVYIPNENRTKGEAFLEENAKREEVHVTESGLQYEILNEGSGPHPTLSDTVEVHYEGMLINGDIFDSSYKHGGPSKFPLSVVIRGWQEGIQLMPVGSTYKFFIPAELAYGARQAGPIPPFSVLIFRVSLLGIY